MRNMMTSSRYAIALALGALALCLASCTHYIAVSEVMQQGVDDKLYTKSNIWYEDPANILSRNVQAGKILPAGSEVEAVSATETELKLRDMSGTEYTISFNPYLMMMTMDEYIRQLLTMEEPDSFLSGITPEMMEAIREGKVIPGMSRREVLICCGYPVAARTPSIDNATWIYYRTANDTYRVLFSGDKAWRIFSLDDLPPDAGK